MRIEHAYLRCLLFSRFAFHTEASATRECLVTKRNGPREGERVERRIARFGWRDAWIGGSILTSL